MNTEKVPLFKNVQTIDFETKIERNGKPNFKKSVIKCAGSTLSTMILNYMKKGGDINNLTPENLFLSINHKSHT